ncbi:hypothetical protein HF888_06610 [Bermanella marisrubri]|uniref:Uncharacterized protein n=1 Tax=Bermanella marisrubri TaxID=207949 RepID=Q1N5A5_9GAMM|nr:hypothetical protein [Bermanella marisrubri]EAT13143.1 hypothetical protein RED65_00245 [Oceanobacter sp. RED65] [Bermanella marisrubri]QIZ83919.1 hypothetical protein HF888_06610 [Bermanella marisrubri]
MPYYTVIPYAYFLKTRLIGRFQRLSWCFIYFVPSILLFFTFQESLSYAGVFNCVLGILIINYIYENGYLQNDVKTVQNEANPTMRLELATLKKLNLYWGRLISLRVFILAALLGLYYLIDLDLFKTLYLVFVSMVLQALYLVYNSCRGRINLFLILPLSYIRFYGFILPFVPVRESFEFLCFTIILYPLSKTLEFSKQEKFSLDLLSKAVGNVDVFRIKYYFFVVLLLLIFVLVGANGNRIYAVIAFYYLVYRTMGFLLITRKQSILREFETLSKSDYRK